MTFGPTIDMFWVGRLGTAAIAGVGVSGMAVMMINALGMGLFTGLRAMVARSVGAGDIRGANHVSQQAFVVGAGYSIAMAAIGIFLAEPILALLGLEADVIAQGAVYMRIQLVGMITMALGMIAQSIMQASGDAVNPMKISLATRILHVALCPFLIFGWWIFPRMGVSGAALTSVISQGIGGAISLWLLMTGRTRLRLTFKNFRFDADIIWRMIKIGIPASINGVERSFSQLILVRIMATYGTVAMAGHTLGQRIEMFMFMPAMGFGQAAGVLAGQNLGADEPERAEKTAWLSSFLIESVMVIGSLVVWFWAENVVRIFNSEAGLVTLASTFLRISIVSMLMMGFTVALMQCLMGVGDTLPPMLVSMLSAWLLQLPLAYFLPKITDLGVYGVRWALVVGMAAQAIAFIIYFRTGKWKQKKV